MKRLWIAFTMVMSFLVLGWIGAGLFGFMINPPFALHYMQGLITTPLHGRKAEMP